MSTKFNMFVTTENVSENVTFTENVSWTIFYYLNI